MSLTATGFDLTFTQPIDASIAADPENYKFRHYFYEYHKTYGSPQFDVQPVSVTGVKVSPDSRKVSVTLANLKPGYIYELKLNNITSVTGEPLANSIICYTLNKLRK